MDVERPVNYLLCIGHSHIHPLEAAFREPDENDPVIFGRSEFVCLLDSPYAPSIGYPDGHSPVANPEWIKMVKGHYDNCNMYIVSAIGGSEYWHRSLCLSPSIFNFLDNILPSSDEPDICIIPYDLALRQAMLDLKDLMIHIELIRALSAGPIIHVLPPPPLEDIVKKIDPANVQVVELLRNELISPACLRLKFWHLYAKATRDICQRLDVVVVDGSSSVSDEHGYLKDDFVQDMIHGNKAWGRVQRQAILREFGLS